VKKSSMAVIRGFTTLLGSKPYLKARIFNKVEQGIEIVKVNKVEIMGINIKYIGDNS